MTGVDMHRKIPMKIVPVINTLTKMLKVCPRKTIMRKMNSNTSIVSAGKNMISLKTSSSSRSRSEK
jgi:hypothetical protein